MQGQFRVGVQLLVKCFELVVLNRDASLDLASLLSNGVPFAPEHGGLSGPDQQAERNEAGQRGHLRISHVVAPGARSMELIFRPARYCKYDRSHTRLATD